MLADYYIIEYATVLLRQLISIQITYMDRVMWAVFLAVNFDTMTDKQLRQVFKVIELV